jgi:hypothetical protein
MEHSPSSGAKSPSASQETPLLLWNKKNHVHKKPPLVPILSEMDPVYISHFISLRSIVIWEPWKLSRYSAGLEAG